MTKIHFFIAIIILAGAVAAVEAVYLARRAAPPAPAIPVAAAPVRPQPAPPPIPAVAQAAAPAEETAAAPLSAAAPPSALAASASPASDAAARSDQELDRARDVLAEHQADNLLDRLNLTDLQRQQGQAAIDQLRGALKDLFTSFGQRFNNPLQQKVRDLRNQGFTDDQIVGLIRPDMEAQADRLAASFQTMGTAMQQLQPILNPDQLQTLNQMTAGLGRIGGGDQMKKMMASDDRLKQFVQMAK